MLDQFRNLSHSLLAKLLLGLLVVSFGIWGIGDMLKQSTHHVVIATVGGTEITANEFERSLNRESENLHRIMGDRYSPDFIKSMSLPQRVLKKLVNRSLMGLESESLGLVPADSDVVRTIRSNPSFQDSKGNFDKNLFEATLKNSAISEKIYVEQLRQGMASDLLANTLTSAAPVSDSAVRTLYNAKESQRSVTIYAIPASLATNIAAPTEAQMSDYYNDHKNEFAAPEYRNVSYLTISPSDAQATPVSEEELNAAYKDRIDEFKHAEQRDVQQLLYSDEAKAKAAAAMLASGKSFSDVAKATDIINKNALSLGKIERSAMLPAAADAVFALPAGGVTAPIQSPFGWHIFKVSAIEPPAVASFEEARPTLEKELKQRDAGAAQSKIASTLEDELAGGATLQEAAAELKLQVHAIGPIDHDGNAPDGSKAKDMPDLDKFIDTAFKTEDKSESSLITSKGGVYYLLHVDKTVPERIRSLDEVRGLVIANWQKNERQKSLSMLAKDIAGKFTDSASRAAIIAQYNLKPLYHAAIKRDSIAIANYALPPELVEDIFTRKPDQSTHAHANPNGDYVIALVTGIIAAPAPETDPKLSGELADIHRNLTEETQGEVLEQYMHYLATKYKVTVNEAAIASILK